MTIFKIDFILKWIYGDCNIFFHFVFSYNKKNLLQSEKIFVHGLCLLITFSIKDLFTLSTSRIIVS